MSTAAFSKHIPDLDLITSYAERQDSVFSRVSPWTKCGGLVLVILLLVLSRNLAVIFLLYCAVLTLYWLAHLPLRKLFAWYALPILFVLSLVGIVAWSEPGNPLFTIQLPEFPLTLTDQGALLVLTLLLKALVSITYSLFFLMTTRYQHFASIISRVFPSPVDQIFLLAYRFLFLTLEMTGSMLKAVRSRGGGIIDSIRVQGRIFAGVFALVFIRSFDRAERVQKAMTARGYNGTYRASAPVPRPKTVEYCALFVSALVILVSVWLVPTTGWW
jgi:cobalt/nickel transport system permease protein